MRKIEVCSTSLDDAREAEAGGAIRIELCSAITCGGVTPSHGLIKSIVDENLNLDINVLIRAREGGFHYTASEIDTMCQDIEFCRGAGADGVVIGALSADGDIDMEACRKMVAAAGDISITFHRAFDMCRDPRKALEELIALGCHRVLTSGQLPTAEAGIPQLKELVQQADGRIIIMPGCGVNSGNAARILNSTGATEIHASARRNVGSGMLFRHSGVSMGNPGSDEYARKETDVNEVRAIINSIKEEYFIYTLLWCRLRRILFYCRYADSYGCRLCRLRNLPFG